MTEFYTIMQKRLLLLIAPTAMLGRLTIAFHIAGVLPEMRICQKVEK